MGAWHTEQAFLSSVFDLKCTCKVNLTAILQMLLFVPQARLVVGLQPIGKLFVVAVNTVVFIASTLLGTRVRSRIGLGLGIVPGLGLVLVKQVFRSQGASGAGFANPASTLLLRCFRAGGRSAG